MSGTDRIAACFQRCRAKKGTTLLPYFTVGFPDLVTTAELIRAADQQGVAAVELGIPYSDSIADGPIIQQAFHDVLAHGQRLEEVFRMVSAVRPAVSCGLIAMVSYSIVHRNGVSAFMAKAASAGFDGIIMPDLPLEESAVAVTDATKAGLCHVGLIAPTTPAVRSRAILESCTGFVYRIAVSGTTGERDGLPAGLSQDVAGLREMSGLPICIGFGIGSAAQVRAVCAFADGVIVGSAIARRIGEAQRLGADRSGVVSSVCGFLSELASKPNGEGT